MAFGAAALIDGLPAAPLVLMSGVLLSWILRSDVLQPGARWSGSQLLRVGVALLGAQLSVAAIVEYGIGTFKRSFGGQSITWAGSWDLVLRPTLYRAHGAVAATRLRLLRPALRAA